MSCYRFIDANRAEFGVRRCCRAVGVSPASFYDWHRRGPSARQRADQRLLADIGRIYRSSGGAYGAPRIHAELQIACGVRVGRKRVARLMRSAGLVGCHRRRRRGLTRRDPGAAPAPDLCQRQFSPPRPDRMWHADYTELPTDQGKLYLVAVVDGCSRLAVGHAMGEHADAALAISAVQLAVWRRGVGLTRGYAASRNRLIWYLGPGLAKNALGRGRQRGTVGRRGHVAVQRRGRLCRARQRAGRARLHRTRRPQSWSPAARTACQDTRRHPVAGLSRPVPVPARGHRLRRRRRCASLEGPNRGSVGLEEVVWADRVEDLFDSGAGEVGQVRPLHVGPQPSREGGRLELERRAPPAGDFIPHGDGGDENPQFARVPMLDVLSAGFRIRVLLSTEHSRVTGWW